MSKDKEITYRSRQVAAACLNALWLCDYRKLAEIRNFLEFRATGGTLDPDVVYAAFSAEDGSAWPGEDGPQDIDGVRYLPLNGIMTPKANLMQQFSGGTSTQKYTQAVREALADDDVKTLLLHVNSPGGVDKGVPELANLIAEARGDKRIVTFADDMMSAALWVGTGADAVYATESADVGSQGVFQIHHERSKAEEAAGETYQIVRAGEYKALANEHEPLTDKARTEMQRRVDELDRKFVSGLARNRGVTEKEVMDRFGRGQVFSAEDAAARGLIDGVRTFNDVLDAERKRNAGVVSVSIGGSKAMNPRVKPALYALGYINDPNTSDEVCEGICRGMCIAKNVNWDDLDEDRQLAAIMSHRRKAVEELVEEVEPAQPQRVAADPPVPLPIEAEYRYRAKQLRLMGEELKVPPKAVLEAIEGTKSIAECRQEFIDLAASEQTGVSIEVGPSSHEKFCMAVNATVMERTGYSRLLTDEERKYGNGLRNQSFLDIAREELRLNGREVTNSPQADADAWLNMNIPNSNRRMFIQPDGSLSARMMDEPSWNRRGDHPDALSQLMNRMLDGRLTESPATYTQWCKPLGEVPNFKDHVIVERGRFNDLDLMPEDSRYPQNEFKSGLKAYLRPHKFGHKVGLTVEMVVDDDLNIFADQLADLPQAARFTVDNHCRDLLQGNPTMADGVAMFDTSTHKNLVTAGAAPSVTSLNTMLQLQVAIKGFGSDRVISKQPDIILAPFKHNVALYQLLADTGIERKVPATDATINPFRGQFTPVVDGQLDLVDADSWYTIQSIDFSPIGYAFVRGFGGEGGQRTTWTESNTGTRWIGVTMAFGIAPINWRGVIKNDGVT